MTVWDGAEYMNEVNWSEKSLKKGYKLEICFWYPEENGASRVTRCLDVVQRVKMMYNKEIKLLVKWEKEFLDVGKNEEGEELLKIACGT